MTFSLFIHRRYDNNIGDKLSSPWSYFRKAYPRALRVEVHLPGGGRLAPLKRLRLRALRKSADLVVIGGGGFLGNEFFQEDVDFWSRGASPKILWGAGHNSHDVQRVAETLPDETHYSQLLPFSAIGLRDWGRGFTWVPCASCMHPGLSGPSSTSVGTLFVIHRDLRGDPSAIAAIVGSAPNDHEVIFNDEPEERIFGKLRAARSIVTNSFHAAYWGSLLRKPVVAIGGGTKVAMLKYQVALSDREHWRTAIRDAPVYDNALEDCRDTNVTFNAHVLRQFVGARRQRPLVAAGAACGPPLEREADFRAMKVVLPPTKRASVPRIIHFVFGLSPTFGGKPFNIMHQIAVRSVFEKFKPDQIILHCEFVPDNAFFNAVKDLVTINKIVAPADYNGRPLLHFAHKADVVRLRALRDTGGIYLDLDTITVKSLDFMLEWSFTIGLQGRNPTQGICNAVMSAAPGDGFVTDWLDKYNQFDATEWDRFSVKLPYLMWRSGKYSINVENYDRFHWPLWDAAGLRLMFEQDHVFPNASVHHLWESKSFPLYFGDYDYAESIARLKVMKSTYARLAAPYI